MTEERKTQAAATGDLTEAAMNTVLRAEQAAESRVSEATLEANAIIQEAQARARRILARTNERITLIHTRCAHYVTSESKRLLDAQTGDEVRGALELDPETLAATVEAVAANLTGGDGD